MRLPWLASIRRVAITDRARMGDFAAAVTRAAAPDVMIQIREKDLDGRPLLGLVRAALATGARVMVNDRLDVALAAGAHGVHLPERGLPIEVARRLVPPGFAIGVSRHTVEDVAHAAADGADLIQLGPIWTTPGKGPALGVAAVAAARAVIGEACLVAVGGIDSEARRAEALHAGAHATAAIRAAWATLDR